ncbi:MAG: von Willebrand factor type A domain-containing protein [Chloroflexota bacterium]|nr:von Willebrand factor type A domain-containing protein [Chloroflexota bacterium]
MAGAAQAGAPPPPSGGALPPTHPAQPNRDYGDTGYVPPSPPSYDTTFFQNYGVNPFIDARADHLSTFAMDVDTASYSVARRFVLDGNTPDPDSVRVEEFVNYFDQEYPQPRKGAFAIHVDGAHSPFTNDTWIARVGIQGRDVPDHRRKDATLVFVIDTSGSMSRENRLELVKRALRLLVRELRPSDQIGIVTYGSRGHAVLNPTQAKHDDYILEVIDRLHPGGSTNAEEGLRLGYEMADRWLDPERIIRVILLSDGVANVGRTGPNAILNQVRKYVNEGVTLSTVGVGMGNYNDVLLEQLANDGDGNYIYIDNLSEAWKSFVDNLTSTLQVIAKDAKIQVSFNPDVVHSYRLIGYENRDVADRDFRNDSVDAGEVGAGHSVTALYELRLHERADGPVAKVHVRYEDPDSRRIFEVDRNFNISDLNEYFESASPRFQLAATVAQYAEVLRRSYWAQHTTLNDVRYHADRVGGILHDDPEVTEFARLVNMAAGSADG